MDDRARIPGGHRGPGDSPLVTLSRDFVLQPGVLQQGAAGY